jgi:dUTP pyrophosphatase
MKLHVLIHHPYLEGKYIRKSNLKGDAGVDLYCPETIVCPPHSTTKIDHHISCKLIDEMGEELSYMLFPRSSIVKTPLRLANSIGLIDSQYRGHIMAFVDNQSDQEYVIREGDRLFQIVGPNLEGITVEIVDHLNETDRGEGGFGSTGR